MALGGFHILKSAPIIRSAGKDEKNARHIIMWTAIYWMERNDGGRTLGGRLSGTVFTACGVL